MPHRKPYFEAAKGENMLQLKNISKKYVTGDLTQVALDDVSLNFRDNEFVAILGPSGSGKTTLLNIIGGLDRYDTGDLVINGISTKKYSDRDWDSYRNHTIGFVFQSYNLIPHQSVLSNVELALTISGVSKTERRQRAIAALEQVGLGDQLHKKPNQMSGGQMQRVAIARALINNPDILLADEPTGALDTATSVQVMDLLKEVAKDRMVIMVTHNPDLAAQYATRIVRLRDGRIIDDSDPFAIDEAAMEPPIHKNMGHSSMSLPTSFGLSVNNLLTKRGRTFLTAFAGSIGIISIALILAVSSGVNDYIQTLEEETMADYPIQVTSSGIDITSMFSSVMGSAPVGTGDEEEDGVSVTRMISNIFSNLNSNDLGSFKEYIESGESDIDDYTKAIEYVYDVEPQLYLEDGDEYHQVNPESTLTSGMGISASMYSLMSSVMSYSTFFQMPENESLYMDSYELKAGHWPEAYNECVLVLSSQGTISDYMVYTLGLKDFDEYVDLIAEAADGEDISEVDFSYVYSYDEIIGTTYKLVNSSDYYEYDSEYDVWTDKTDNDTYMRQLVADGEDVTIVGVVQPLEDAASAALTEGVNYPASLITHVAEAAENSEVVQAQLGSPDINVLTGEEFGEDANFDLASIFELDEDAMDELFDTDAIMDTFSESLDFSSIDFSDMDLSSIDTSSMNLDLDMSNMDLTAMMGDMDLSSMMGEMDISSFVNISPETISAMSQQILSGYSLYAQMNGLSTFTDLQNDFASYLESNSAQSIMKDALEDMVQGVMDDIAISDVKDLLKNLATDDEKRDALEGWIMEQLDAAEVPTDLASNLVSGYESYVASEGGQSVAASISEGFNAYLASDTATQMMTMALMSMLDTDALQTMISSMLTASMQEMMASMGTAISEQIGDQMSAIVLQMSDQMTSAISSAMEDIISGMADDMSDSFADAMSIDTDSVMDAFSVDMDEDSLMELMSSMSVAAGSDYGTVLANLGYADYDNPTEIDIYPKDFDSKEYVVNIIDEYNSKMADAGQDEKQISYTDLVGTMMSTVTTIINLVSYVLIAFVSVSLIVSSIMIGIITYISVLERTREIGILRAIGASKKNVSRIFNVETFIVGFCAGLLGVLIARLILVPINMVVQNFVQAENAKAFLPVSYAVILVVLSVVLTLIGGIIPSRKAAKMDPVSALRSE